MSMANTPRGEPPQHRSTRMQTLMRLHRLIASSLHLDDVLGALAQATTTLLDVPAVWFWLADETTQTLRLHQLAPPATDGEAPRQPLRFGQGGAGWVATHRQPLTVSDRATDTRLVAQEWWDTPHLCRAFMTPVVYQGALCGVLVLIGHRPCQGDTDAQHLLEGLVAQAAVAIQNAREYQETAKQRRRLETLAEVSQRLTRGLDLTTVLKDIAEAAALVFGGEAGFRLLEGEELVRVGATPGALAAMQTERLPVAGTFCGRVVTSGDIMVSHEAEADKRILLSNHRAAMTGRIGAVMCFPIGVGGRIVGTLHLFRERGYGFEQTDRQLAMRLADQAGIAIENARLYKRLEATHRELVDTARKVGMAEVATGVLHNVGNVLNSVGVTTASITRMIGNSRASYLSNVVKMLAEHANDLGAFLTTDDRGRRVPTFLAELSRNLTAEQEHLLEAVEKLTGHVQHITEIVNLQQSYGKISALSEPVLLSELVEDAMRINGGALSRHGIDVKREYAQLPSALFDRPKVLQIMTNLISNAKYALSQNGRDTKILTLRIKEPADGRVRIEVADNGMGIAEDKLTRIFGYGFTTRKDGHGFGLHSGALAAKEMEGSLTAQSEGPGQGAVFTLELPFKLAESKSAS